MVAVRQTRQRARSKGAHVEGEEEVRKAAQLSGAAGNAVLADSSLVIIAIVSKF
jgi:hypothetical protein